MTRAEQMRIDAGMTPQELADAAEVARGTITRLEAGENVGPGRLFAIARVLSDVHGVTVRPSELQRPAWDDPAEAAA